MPGARPAGQALQHQPQPALQRAFSLPNRIKETARMTTWIVKPLRRPPALIAAATRDEAYTRACALYGWITSTQPLRRLATPLRQGERGQP